MCVAMFAYSIFIHQRLNSSWSRRILLPGSPDFTLTRLNTGQVMTVSISLDGKSASSLSLFFPKIQRNNLLH